MHTKAAVGGRLREEGSGSLWSVRRGGGNTCHLPTLALTFSQSISTLLWQHVQG
jgi:hypothetical protein